MTILCVERIPLGGTKEFKDVIGSKFYRIYIPTRWGGELTVSITNGWLELYYPDISTKIAGPDTTVTYTIPFERNNEHIDGH